MLVWLGLRGRGSSSWFIHSQMWSCLRLSRSQPQIKLCYLLEVILCPKFVFQCSSLWPTLGLDSCWCCAILNLLYTWCLSLLWPGREPEEFVTVLPCQAGDRGHSSDNLGALSHFGFILGSDQCFSFITSKSNKLIPVSNVIHELRSWIPSHCSPFLARNPISVSQTLHLGTRCQDDIVRYACQRQRPSFDHTYIFLLRLSTKCLILANSLSCLSVNASSKKGGSVWRMEQVSPWTPWCWPSPVNPSLHPGQCNPSPVWYDACVLTTFSRRQNITIAALRRCNNRSYAYVQSGACAAGPGGHVYTCVRHCLVLSMKIVVCSWYEGCLW